MNKEIFDPEKYGMAICPGCDSRGFIQGEKRQCCPTCGGFGFIVKEAKQDTNDTGSVITASSAKEGGI